MASISIQFHALPEEVLVLLEPFVDEVRAHVTVMTFQPFEASQGDKRLLLNAFQDASVDRVALTLSSPVLPVHGMNEFLDRNPGALIVDIGRRTDEGLKESWLTASAESPDALAAWRTLAKRLRSATRTGVVAVNPQTGATAKLKDHRFSEGARALSRDEVLMLPAAGSSRLRLTE